MDETAHFFTEDFDHKRKGTGVDEGVAIFLNLLVSCSCWSVIDGVVLTVADGDFFIAIVFYIFLTLFGTLAYLMFNSEQNYTLHAKVPEVLSLAITCVGSWGTVNSIVSMLAKQSSRTETAIHFTIVVVASIAIFVHHRYRRQNFIFDLILR